VTTSAVARHGCRIPLATLEDVSIALRTARAKSTSRTTRIGGLGS
jgi:hypothetical protein